MTWHDGPRDERACGRLVKQATLPMCDDIGMLRRVLANLVERRAEKGSRVAAIL